MLNKCAVRLTNILYDKTKLDIQKRKIYVYGFEIALSTLLDILCMVLVSLLFFKGTYILAFLFFFMFTRFFTGGFHAKTYASCFLLSNGLFLICCFTISLLVAIHIWWLPLLPAILCVPVVLWYTPIRNEKHPLSEISYKRNRRFSRVLVPVQLGIILLMAFSASLREFYIASCISLVANAIMMIIAIYRKEKD